MTIHIRTVEFYIDNGPAFAGEMSANQEHRLETTDLPKPDERWEFTDSNGHYHAYSSEGDGRDHYPTLDRRTEHVDCDGSCGGVCEGEGYSITRYSCRICREEVKPGSIPGPHTFTVPGMKTWTVTVYGYVPDELVSVRIKSDDMDLFGVAQPVHWENRPDGARTELIGVGPLGSRKP